MSNNNNNNNNHTNTYVVNAGDGTKPSFKITKQPMPSPLTSCGNPTTAALL